MLFSDFAYDTGDEYGCKVGLAIGVRVGTALFWELFSYVDCLAWYEFYLGTVFCWVGSRRLNWSREEGVKTEGRLNWAVFSILF